MARAGVVLVALALCACVAPMDADGWSGEEAQVDESDFPSEALFEAGGERLRIPEIADAFSYTRVWTIGDAARVTRVYLLVHGDGNTDYSDSTATDRAAMAARLSAGEGAIVAYPVSPSSHWPAFEGGRDGYAVLQLFDELARRAGDPNVAFEQFALSGGGRVNHALMRLIDEQYGVDPRVTRFVDTNLRGIHDGDSLCYSIDRMQALYIRTIERFPQVRFAFIHNTSGQMSYVHSHHEAIARAFGGSYPFGGSLALQDGRLRFWAAPTHWTAWKGQFARVFFGEDAIAPPAPARPEPRWIGDACAASADCATEVCFAERDGFPGGMCTRSCTSTCPDRSGQPITACIAGTDGGYCVSRVDLARHPGTGCRAGYHGERRQRPSSSTRRDVCVPD